MIFDTLLKRFLLATLLWLVFWPVFWFMRIGDITGPKAWFWIVGELSYPVVACAYFLLDSIISRFGMKPWMVFVSAVVLIAVAMPYYYHRYGFALGVTIEARFL